MLTAVLYIAANVSTSDASPLERHDVIPRMSERSTNDAKAGHDFDFLIGRWVVRHKRLRTRLSGSHDWEEFTGWCESKSILGGKGNIDENVIALPGGTFRAATVRMFDSTTGRWAIWWHDERMPLQLDPPVIGSFKSGVGQFFADDTCAGRKIRVRFIWSRITATSAHWEQAFSVDGGETWETNWYMEFQRIDHAP
jgi:hypothetical protein